MAFRRNSYSEKHPGYIISCVAPRRKVFGGLRMHYMVLGVPKDIPGASPPSFIAHFCLPFDRLTTLLLGFERHLDGIACPFRATSVPSWGLPHCLGCTAWASFLGPCRRPEPWTIYTLFPIFRLFFDFSGLDNLFSSWTFLWLVGCLRMPPTTKEGIRHAVASLRTLGLLERSGTYEKSRRIWRS